MTNFYCEALTALRSAPHHYLKEVGDQWRTPDLLFWGINAMFGPLMLDLFADDSNAKCPVWYTAEDNALTQDWSEMLSSIGVQPTETRLTAALSTTKSRPSLA
ncbi:DNA adenine methylase [Klebsiella variicola]|nr:DNA adenine methylase [Klebsiella variicola]